MIVKLEMEEIKVILSNAVVQKLKLSGNFTTDDFWFEVEADDLADDDTVVGINDVRFCVTTNI